MIRAHAVALSLLAVTAICRGAQAEEGPARVEWKWKSPDVWEYPVTAVALGGAFYLRFAGPTPSANWKGGILADDWIQEHTALQSTVQRDKVVTLTDYFFYGSMAYRFVDSALLPTVVWGKPSVALQLSFIDLESFGFSAIALWGGQGLFGRERPFAKHCEDPKFAAAESGCPANASEHNRSFFAGHPATVLTAAGLTCTHHSHLPLYGGGAPDMIACGLLIGAAGMTAIGREIAEKHHASDVAFGLGVGVFSGWVLPELLHYGRAKPAPDPAPAPVANAAPLVRASFFPMIGAHDLGLGLGGVM